VTLADSWQSWDCGLQPGSVMKPGFQYLLGC
jgi:hypothetical protein